jgi:RES domain-containing protein
VRVRRITRAVFAVAPFAPFDGEGPYRVGSRWNNAGRRMAFSSPTASLALLEILVHIDRRMLPTDFVLVEADVPDDAIADLSLVDLPADWRSNPPGAGTRRIGDQWLESASSLGLRVPSVVIPSESNVLLNPLHERAVGIGVKSIEPLEIDRRLF